MQYCSGSPYDTHSLHCGTPCIEQTSPPWGAQDVSLAVMSEPTTNFKVFECIDMQSSIGHIHTANVVQILSGIPIIEIT